jgi:hypothetical protein
MSARAIAAALGSARREGRGWRCRCPLHGGVSLALADGADARLLVTCWAGCDRRAVLSELRRLGLLDGAAAAPLLAETIALRRREAEERRRRTIAIARDIWTGATADTGLVLRYLASRGITIALPPTLRLHPALRHSYGIQRPAMIALVEHVQHGFVAAHATYLAIDGSKAAIDPQRKCYGPVAGSAVRLASAQPDRWLVVAEGVETALSVMQATGLPAWAALSAGGLAGLVLPPEARRVLIAADHDFNGTGRRAGYAAARRWLAEGRRVWLAMPPTPDTDFNDVLRGHVVSCIQEGADVAG